MAWTGNFKDRIDNLAGSLSPADDDAIQEWIRDGCYDVLSKAVAKMGEDEAWKFTAKSGNQESNDIDVDEIRTIAGVVRNGVFAVKGKWGLKDKYADANSIYAATVNDPVWYLSNSTLSIYPAPVGGQPANYHYIPEYAVTDWNTGTSSINDYPSEYYYYVALYAAIQVLHRRMVDSAVPTSPTFDTFAAFAGTLANLTISATPPTNLGADPAITYSATAVPAKADISGNQPTYTKPSTTITAVAPDTPVIASVTYSSASNVDAASPTISITSYVAPTTVLPVFSITSALPAVFDINSITIPSATITAPNITAEGVDTLTLPDVTTNVPYFSQDGASNARIGFGTGTGQQFAALATKAITSLSVTAVAPDTPTIATVSYSPASTITVAATGDTSVSDILKTGTVSISSITAASAAQPNYVAPTVTGAANLAGALEVGATIGLEADENDFGKWFSVLGQLIEDEEDTELASAQMQKISTFINAYQADVQNALNEFNQETQIYQQLVQQGTQNANATNQAVLNDIQRLMQENQADLQKNQAIDQANFQKDIQEAQTNAQMAQAKALQDAQQTVQGVIANNSALIQKYQAEFSIYQGEVSTQVQEYGQNFQKDLQLWQNTQTQVMQQHSQTMQDALNVFNAQNARYQANIQAEMLRAQTLAAESQKEADIAMQAKIQDYTFELSEWSQEVQRYQANVGSQVQEYQQEIARYQASVASETQEFQGKVSKYNAEQQDAIQTANIANQAHLQQAQSDLQVAVRNKDKDLEVGIQNAVNTMQSIIQDNQAKVTTYQAELQAYQAEVASEAQVIQINVQNELNEFNKEGMIYTSNIQAELAKFQADADSASKTGELTLQAAIQDFTLELQAFQAEVVKYQAEVNDQVTEYTQNLQKALQTWTAEQANKLQKYQAELQADGVGYQWLQDQYNRLKADYERAFAVPQQQQQAVA